jgi:hypothetical protein
MHRDAFVTLWVGKLRTQVSRFGSAAPRVRLWSNKTVRSLTAPVDGNTEPFDRKLFSDEFLARGAAAAHDPTC